jgi:hypothetical protein
MMPYGAYLGRVRASVAAGSGRLERNLDLDKTDLGTIVTPEANLRIGRLEGGGQQDLDLSGGAISATTR